MWIMIDCIVKDSVRVHFNYQKQFYVLKWFVISLWKIQKGLRSSFCLSRDAISHPVKISQCNFEHQSHCSLRLLMRVCLKSAQWSISLQKWLNLLLKEKKDTLNTHLPRKKTRKHVALQTSVSFFNGPLSSWVMIDDWDMIYCTGNTSYTTNNNKYTKNQQRQIERLK